MSRAPEPRLRVSVVIPVHDALPFLEEAVRSCLDQPEVAEVLLVDDGSRDGSRERAEALAAASDRVRALRHADGRNHGIAATRNLGLAEAGCDWVAFLDADDRFLEGRFAEPVRRLAADPSLDGVYEAVGTVFEDEDARAQWRDRGRPLLTAPARAVAPEALFELLVRGGQGHLHTAGMLVRRGLALEVGGFDPRLAVGEDTALWLRLAAVGRLAPGRLEQPVAERRARRGSVTAERWGEYEHFHGRLWEDLLGWCDERKLAPGLRRAVLDRVVHHRMRAAARAGAGGLARRGRQLATAAALAVRHPGVLARRTWWRWLGWSLGVPGGGRRRGATA